MSRHPDQGAMKTVAILTHRGIAAEPEHPINPRLIAAEVVAAAALYLVDQWHAWESLNRTTLAAIGTQDHGAALKALTAYELLDAAVNAWTPHSHGRTQA
jgi:hypothetical protein